METVNDTAASTASVSTRRFDPGPLGWVIAAMVATLLLYRETALSMVALWNQSETFAHGYVVPLISAWLVWRRRAALAALKAHVGPSPLALLFVAAAAWVWLVGDAANVNALRHFALVAMLVFIVPAVSGWRVARAILFPLGFLFFAVPFGEFLMPALMQHTADFTVLALQLTGVPVHRDGLQIFIPTGTWSIVEACSGVRYLIASLMVGALYAHLNYRSTRRRFLFMVVAFLVPIVANWVRAYATVMLGHLSSNRLAVGVDHLIYGWAFFGVVIGLMFLIGSRWSEPEADDPIVPAAAVPPSSAATWRHAVATVCAVALLAMPVALAHHADASVLSGTPKIGVPAPLAALPPAGAEMPEWDPAYSGFAASMHRRVDYAGRPAGVYVGYYRQQNARGKLLSSVNMLATSGGSWRVVSTGDRTARVGDETVGVSRAVLRKRRTLAEEPGLVVWRTYWVDDRFEPDPGMARLRAAVQRLAGRGDDAAVVLFYTVEGTDADATLEALMRQALGTLRTQLRLARDGD